LAVLATDAFNLSIAAASARPLAEVGAGVEGLGVLAAGLAAGLAALAAGLAAGLGVGLAVARALGVLDREGLAAAIGMMIWGYHHCADTV
jgi:hypothetical protein